MKIIYIPISAFSGENLYKKTEHKWYKGTSLLMQLESLEHTYINSSIKKPVRLTIKNMFKGINKKNGYGFTVKVESGILEENDKVLIMPKNEITHITHIYKDDKKAKFAISGETIEVIAHFNKEEDFESVRKGFVICDFIYPIPFVKKFKAKIYTLNLNFPIIPGTKFNIHISLQTTPGVFKKLLKILDANNDNEVVNKPRLIQSR